MIEVEGGGGGGGRRGGRRGHAKANDAVNIVEVWAVAVRDRTKVGKVIIVAELHNVVGLEALEMRVVRIRELEGLLRHDLESMRKIRVVHGAVRRHERNLKALALLLLLRLRLRLVLHELGEVRRQLRTPELRPREHRQALGLLLIVCLAHPFAQHTPACNRLCCYREQKGHGQAFSHHLFLLS